MSESLWDCKADQLLQRVSSTAPTPGGGSVAAVTAALGLGLVQMAVGITLAGIEETTGTEHTRLTDAQRDANNLQAQAVEAADRDIAEFDALMAGYRMPRGSDEERATRKLAIDDATVTAIEGPLSLAELSVAGITLANEVESSVKPTIVSDVRAGRDLLRAAALAALRTADINLEALEKSNHPDASALRERRDAALKRATSNEESA